LEFRGIMGGFYRISEWIMRISIINLLWVVCSAPFFFLILVVITSPEINVDMMKQIGMLISLVSPFTLIPATAAMFSVARKWVMGDEDVPLFKTFFRGYKENYLQSMLGGIIFVLLGYVFYINYYFYGTQKGYLNLISIVFVALFFVLVASFINFISILVHFHMKLLQIVKNAFLLSIGNPINSFMLLVLNGFLIYISSRFTFMIPFFVGSLMSYISFWFFFRNYQKIQEKLEKMKEASAEEAEPIDSLESDGKQVETLENNKP
jgi:uncharacterized membrane protein YesL